MTTVHTTFLDSYEGAFGYGGKGKYGDGSDWSDSYFSRDKETYPIFGLTQGPLEHCYNVDVTFLDPNKKGIDVFYATPLLDVQSCYRTVTSHSWPYAFYTNTIPPNVLPESDAFGFPLSKEGGKWDFARNQYPVGNQTPHGLGTPDPECFVRVNQVKMNEAFLNPNALPSEASSTGSAQKYNYWVRLVSGSPVWLSMFVTITNSVNLVSFDTRFEGTNAGTGLLTVYWGTNIIGSIDQRVIHPTFQRYSFRFPNASAGSHTLGFRLDTFTNIQTSAIVTNVTLGLMGVSQPFSLLVTTNVSDGLRVFQLIGQPGFTYTVEASTNLLDWNPIALLINTNGTVRFVDSNQTNAPQRFYRAVVPY